MAFPFDSLAPELQLKVLESLDLGSLAIASRLNKNISRETTRLLWQNIEFQSIHDGQNLDTVHNLKLSRTPGAAILFGKGKNEVQWNNEFNWLMSSGGRSIFDIVADFSHLRCFHMYCKFGFGNDHYMNETITRMRGTLPKLRELAIGGIINKDVVLGLLSFPEKIERFCAINLQDGEAGQAQHSGGLLFLKPLAPRFANLTHLHLCKLAELVESERGLTYLRWNFDYENDRAVLSERAVILSHVSETLVELTLEDRYLASPSALEGRGTISPGVEEGDDPMEWGEGSRRRFGEIVLPVLTSEEWPKLQRLVLAGVVLNEAKGRDGKLNRMLSLLRTRSIVKIEPGRFARFTDEVTPIDISPPEWPFEVGGYVSPTNLSASQSPSEI